MVRSQPVITRCSFFRNTFAKATKSRKSIAGHYCFIFDTMAAYEHALLHIVILYNNTTCIPCLPLSPCTDDDCKWSHSFIFYIIVGASFCFLGLFFIIIMILCCYFEIVWWVSVGKCVFVWERVCVCTVAYCMCGWQMRKRDWMRCLVALCSAPNAHQPFACVHHCASVFRCSLAPTSIHPNEEKKELEMKRRRQTAFSLRGKKHIWEKILLKKGYFSPLRGHKEECKFLS